MLTLKSKRNASGGLCGPNAVVREQFSDPEDGQSAPYEGLIITGSFNGLMDRVAKIDVFNVWLEGRKIIKKARKLKIPATMLMSLVQELTGLSRDDLELFTTAIPLIEVVEPGADPLLSFSEVFCLVKLFERMVDHGELR